MNKYEIAEIIRNSDNWMDVSNEIEELVELAGLTEEYKAADGESFEVVIEKAAEILEVEIY
jgi:hypothetical protein